MTTTNNAFAVISYSSVGFGVYRGYARTLADAKSSAEMMTVREGNVLVVESKRTGARQALIGGRWVRNPSTLDIVAATREIEPGYAHHLIGTIATSACDKGRTWTTLYLSSGNGLDWRSGDVVAL